MLKDYGRREILENRFYLHPSVSELMFITKISGNSIAYDYLGGRGTQLSDKPLQVDFCSALMQLRNKDIRIRLLGRIEEQEKQWIIERLERLKESPFKNDIKREDIGNY